MAYERFRNEIQITPKDLQKTKRKIYYHDIPVGQDIIISVDRFYEIFYKNKLKVSIPDLIVLGAAKYLIPYAPDML